MDHLEEHLVPADEVRVIYFGPAWSPHLLTRSRRVATPLGEKCYLCDEPVVEDDRGLVKAVARMGQDGEPYGDIKPVHVECDMFLLIGHDVGVCPCTGYPSTRASALLAWQRARLDGMRH